MSEHLKPWVYRNPELFTLEVEELFKKQWMLVCHSSEIAQKGDYYTFDAFREKIFIIRDYDDQIHAFHNVCRHRNSRLLEGRNDTSTGNCPKLLVCPFHGWSYHLDGSIKNIPQREKFAAINQDNHHLVSVEMEVWMGYVFVKLRAGDAPSIAKAMAPFEAIIKSYRMADCIPVEHARSRSAMPHNWKIIHDVDNEGYHVPIGHPSLRQLYGGNYLDFAGDSMLPTATAKRLPADSISSGIVSDKPASIWSVRMYKQLLPDFPHLPDRMQKLWLYIKIFPNVVLTFYPEKIGYYMTLPVSPNQTIIRSNEYHLADDRRVARAVRYLSTRIDNQTSKEDNQFVGWLDAAMDSSAYMEPTLSATEAGVTSFHQALKKVLPVLGLDQAPEESLAVLNQRLRVESASG